jgi:LruC domain-containing protein
MYYPNIANGDFSGATTTFPKDTKIGFILKSNGWGCLGKDYAVNGSYSNYKPVWASSTDGLSTSLETGKNYSNPNGESRTAKFSFESANGNKYAIISFEDANDDKDYDDLVFALNPANAFEEVNGIENRSVSTFGVYGFEDKWPLAHDYDMNDGLVEVEHVKEFYCHAGSDQTLVKETFNFKTDHNYITQQNSFGVMLNTKDTIATIYANKAATGTAPDPSAATVKNTINSGLKSACYSHPNFTTVVSSTSHKNGVYYFYFNDIYNGDKGKTTYSIEVSYLTAQSESKASVQVFLCRKEGSSYREVHVPYEAPGPKVNTKYFGTEDDKSDHANKKDYYTSTGEYPFAFYLDGIKLEALNSTLLDPAKESIPIDLQFPTFISWSISKGATNQDWYLNPDPNATKPENNTNEQ